MEFNENSTLTIYYKGISTSMIAMKEKVTNIRGDAYNNIIFDFDHNGYSYSAIVFNDGGLTNIRIIKN